MKANKPLLNPTFHRHQIRLNSARATFSKLITVLLAQFHWQYSSTGIAVIPVSEQDESSERSERTGCAVNKYIIKNVEC